MPFISSAEVKTIREELKKTFPEYKLSVTCENHSTVRVSIMEGPMEFEEGHEQINHYYINEHYKDRPNQAEMLSKVLSVIEGKKEVRIVSRDTDYGDWPNYYINIQVGKWDRPYKRKAA